jgi:tetratricopeptide (TPR) repeat protein
MKMLMGESSKLFANHFLLKADAYFHSGTYPSVFDTVTNKEPEGMMADAHDDHDHNHGAEHHESIYGEPHDPIERLGRNFYPTLHDHLDQPGEAREIMPWLKLSAELDPQKLTTYVAASYWLRKDPKHADEAETFLRQGLRANPDSYEILYELGRLYSESRHDAIHARNLWELALKRWEAADTASKKPDPAAYDAMLAELATLEEKENNLPQALKYLEMELKVTPYAPIIQKRIDEMKQKIAAGK